LHSVFSSCYCDTATLCYLVGIYLDAIHIDWVEQGRGKSLGSSIKYVSTFQGVGVKVMVHRHKKIDDMVEGGVKTIAKKSADVLYGRPLA
jgi:hypothetical protein